MDEHLTEIPCLICGVPLSAYVEEHSFVPALVVDNRKIVLDWTRAIADDYEVLNYYCPECYTEYTISEMKEILDAMQKEALS